MIDRMKKIFAFKTVIFGFLVGLLYHAPLCLAETIYTIPQPKQNKLTGEKVAVGFNSDLRISIAFEKHFKSAVTSLKQSLASLPETANNLPVTIKLRSDSHIDTMPDDAAYALNHVEGYLIEVTGKDLKIIGSDELGTLHGLTTFQKMIIEGKGKVKQGIILDWPDNKVRALHVALNGVRPEVLKQLIKTARYEHFNVLVLQIRDSVSLDTMKIIARKGAWSKEELSDVLFFAKENGLEPIPELKLLTHQEKLLKSKYPHLMYNKSTYDPRKEETYDLVLPMINEIINLISPHAIHIGHDEVAGYSPTSRRKWLLNGEKTLPPELFLKDVVRLYSYLKERGIETWMWGDMLISPKEFPEMLKKHLHGTLDNYFAIRNQIPKEILICDWHYFDNQSAFPSAKAFAMAGHRVIGTTYKDLETTKNFSEYIANLPKGGEGMMVTTWGYVQRKEWAALNRIIEGSGEFFWNAR